MTEFFRDPAWQFIGVIIAVIATFVAIYGNKIQKVQKSLSYDLLTLAPLLTFGDKLKGKLQIIYDGTLIENAHVAIFRIYNSGNQPIISSDYVEPLSISFGENAKILDTEILSAKPNELELQFEVKTSKITFVPTLLNVGDSFLLRVLLTHPNHKPSLTVHSRIIGISHIGQKSIYRWLYLRSVAWGVLVMITNMALSYAIANFIGESGLGTVLSIFVFTLTLLGIMAISLPLSIAKAERSIYEEQYLGKRTDE